MYVRRPPIEAEALDIEGVVAQLVNVALDHVLGILERAQVLRFFLYGRFLRLRLVRGGRSHGWFRGSHFIGWLLLLLGGAIIKFLRPLVRRPGIVGFSGPLILLLIVIAGLMVNWLSVDVSWLGLLIHRLVSHIVGFRLHIVRLRLHIVGLRLHIVGLRLHVVGLRLHVVGLRLHVVGLRLHVVRFGIRCGLLRLTISSARCYWRGLRRLRGRWRAQPEVPVWMVDGLPRAGGCQRQSQDDGGVHLQEHKLLEVSISVLCVTTTICMHFPAPWHIRT